MAAWLGGAWVPAAAQSLDPLEAALLREALEAAAAEDWPRVARLRQEIRQPQAADLVRWRHMLGDGGSFAFAEIAAFLLDRPGWPLARSLQIVAEDRIVDPVDHALVLRLFDRRPPVSVRGHVRYAEALFAAGRDADGQAMIRKAWIGGVFAKAEEAQILARHGAVLRTEDHVARLDDLLWHRHWVSARRMLDRVPAAERRLATARLRLQQRQPGVDAAVRAVPAALQEHPGLMFDRLRWRREQQKDDGVIALLRQPPGELVHPSLWWFERELQLKRALRAGDHALAYRLASGHGQRAGKEFAEAEWLAGWLALRFLKQPDAALAHFKRLHEGVSAPISLARAAYWAGRSAAALGDPGKAELWYRQASRFHITYYGQLAADELGHPLPQVPPPQASEAERAALAGKELAQLARLLIDARAGDLLAPFLLRLAEEARSPAEVGLIADLAALAQRPDLVTRAGRYAAYGGQLNEAASFPIPALPALYDLPAGYPEPALLLGVARQESLFDPEAASRAGARGLLQLMPGTAQLVADQLGLPYNAGLLTGAPAYNVRLGGHYLKTMLERFDGEPALALAAYNAGPNRVERWLAQHGDPGRDRHALIDWIELIPFDETRNYVQRVIEGQRIYQGRLAAADIAMVPFRAVNGPLDPLPLPRFKSGAPVAVASDAPAAAPLPSLKPEDAFDILPAGFASPPLPRLKPRNVEIG